MHPGGGTTNRPAESAGEFCCVQPTYPGSCLGLCGYAAPKLYHADSGKGVFDHPELIWQVKTGHAA